MRHQCRFQILWSIRVGQGYVFCNDCLYIIECCLMYLIPMPKDLPGLQGSGAFGMTTLSYQWGEWGKHVSALHPKISVVLDHSKKSTKVFDSSWRCKCEDCLYLFLLWFYTICCEYISQVLGVQNLDFQAFTFRPASCSLVSTSLSFTRWSSRLAHVMNNKSSKYVFTNLRATISTNIFHWKISGDITKPIDSLW